MAMIDSGAEVNVIGRDLVERLRLPERKGVELILKGCAGESTVSKWVAMSATLNNGQQCDLLLVVSDFMGSAIILGTPFLKSTKAKLDFGSQLLETSKGFIQLISLPKLEGTNLVATIEVQELPKEDKERLASTLDKSKLEPHQRAQLEKLLLKYGDLWVGNPRGATPVLKHRIEVTTSKPIRQAPRRFTEVQRKVVDEEVDKMLRDNVIRPSNSPHAQEVVLVKKKTGDWRFCIDFRKLNDVTIDDEYPLPRIQDLLRSVRDSKYFVALDLRSGYWQILMDDDSIPLTAFRTHRGLYEFTVMPFGLKNAPASFSRLMQDVLGHLHWRGVCIYLDDVLIHGRDFDDTLRRLEEVLEALRQAKLTLAMNKCDFFPKSLLYLGVILEDGLLKPNPSKVAALNHLKDPRNVSEIRSLLGCTGFFRPFIKDYATLAEPLTRLLKKKVAFQWGPEQVQAREKLIQQLQDITLNNPMETDELRLDTDASDTAIGAVLLSKGGNDEDWHPVEFVSKNLNETQRRWPVHEREAYAIVHALERFDAYLRGRSFTVYTDNSSLQWMSRAKVGKISRWASRMAEYDMSIVYKKGKTNVCADFLSRYIDNEQEEMLPERATVWTVQASPPTPILYDHNSSTT